MEKFENCCTFSEQKRLEHLMEQRKKIKKNRIKHIKEDCVTLLILGVINAVLVLMFFSELHDEYGGRGVASTGFFILLIGVIILYYIYSSIKDYIKIHKTLKLNKEIQNKLIEEACLRDVF
ncbi:MAG: hypothetical protein LBM02_06430 [Lachnospiraceae bacterium]|nr:hypothetical protein [Lachnospiraceae bacterium]